MRLESLRYFQNPTLSYYLHRYQLHINQSFLAWINHTSFLTSLFKIFKLLDCFCITPNDTYFNSILKAITEHIILNPPITQAWNTHPPDSSQSLHPPLKPFHRPHEIIPSKGLFCSQIPSLLFFIHFCAPIQEPSSLYTFYLFN